MIERAPAPTLPTLPVRPHLALEDGQHHVVAKTTSGKHGRFHFSHVPPGHYTVCASEPHAGHGAAGVDVHAGHTSNVHVALR